VWCCNFNQELYDITVAGLVLAGVSGYCRADRSIEMDDFNNVPFNQKDGPLKAMQLFSDRLNIIMEELK
jgi:hypothetical protein